MSTRTDERPDLDDSDIVQRVAHLHRYAPSAGCRAFCGYVFPEPRTVPRFDLPVCRVCEARKSQGSWVPCETCGGAA